MLRRSTFISNLLEEKASELRHAEVTNGYRCADKCPFVLLDALVMHQADPVSQHFVNELLVSCDQSLLAGKLFLVLQVLF